MKITAEALKRLNACADQVALFEQHFPEGCIVTEEAALKAVAAGLDVAWFMRRQERPLREAYEQQARPLWEAYAQQRRLLREAHERQRALCACRVLLAAEEETP